MRGPTALRAAVLLALLSLAACSTRPVTQPASHYPAACTLLPPPTAGADTITVAVPQQAHGEGPTRDPLLAHQLYETLITVDCLGTVRPALAASWERRAGGARWAFALRPEARFWDGTPVTARHVVQSWRDVADASTLVDSVAAEGDRIVHVYLRRPQATPPPLLAGLDFAVTLPQDTTPLGSGPYRTGARTGTSSDRPVIRTVDAPARDLRDLLGRAVDVMVTSDPNVIRYAAQRPHLAVRPLPWNKSYVLLAPSRMPRSGAAADSSMTRLAEGLAQDAVRADARAAQPPFWWVYLQECSGLPSDDADAFPRPEDADQPDAARSIRYPADDPVARGLAERLVALASMDTMAVPDAATLAAAVPGLIDASSEVVAAGVSSQELDQHLADGRDAAYVIALPRHPYDPCAEAHALLRRVPWLAPTGATLHAVLVPLVDTRSHVIARTGRVGLAVDGYGNLRFVPE